MIDFFVVIDASAKPPSGIMYGNHFVAGNFDECINIWEVKNETTIQGKYCSVVLTPSAKFPTDLTLMLDGVLVSINVLFF